jgi:D-alanyl-D-alanine carboxypeptidase (penicillin-binding protein 5/6)
MKFTKTRLTRFLFCGALAAWLGTPLLAAAATHSAGASSTPKSGHSGSIARSPYVGAIAVDAATGKVLFEDQADAKGYPASMLKLMDMLIIQEKLEAGQLSLQDQVPVSAKAAKTGGSQVWLAEKESFTLEDMLYALMIKSANDAAVAITEKVAGSTDAFVELMNKRARELGMNSTVFHSVHGLPPAAGQQHDVTTPRDFVRLCHELLKHPDILRYTSTRERPFRPNAGNKTVIMQTHNHLLGHVEGCDGLKTGYTAAAGFSISATAARNGQRVIVIVMGSTDLKTRDAKAKEILAKAFAQLNTAPPTTVAGATPAGQATPKPSAPSKK